MDDPAGDLFAIAQMQRPEGGVEPDDRYVGGVWKARNEWDVHVEPAAERWSGGKH
jgi:hypothetical protein